MIIKMLVLVSFQLTLLNFYSPPDFEEPIKMDDLIHFFFYYKLIDDIIMLYIWRMS